MTMRERLDVDAVLFDLDGTLADTAGDLAGALNRVRADHGRAPLPVGTLRPHASSGARGLLGAGMGIKPGDEGYEAARDAFLVHYSACLAETTRLFDGVAAMLSNLEARGLAWGIVTNKSQRFTLPLMEALGYARRAACIVSGDSSTRAKPHARPMHLACS